MSDLRERVVELVREKGYQHREEPFKLASGQLSHDYIDGKIAVAQGRDLRLVAEAAVGLCATEFDAVGGLTMGADPLAHGIAATFDTLWFSVRKQPKGRGLDQWIEGAHLGAQHRVLLVDDVVSTGGSIIQAYDRVIAVGATVVAVVTLVDRGDIAAPWFEERSIPYFALVSYRDLSIPPVEPVLATSAR